MWKHSRTEVVRVSYEIGFAPENFESTDCRFGREAMGENYPLVS